MGSEQRAVKGDRPHVAQGLCSRSLFVADHPCIERSLSLSMVPKECWDKRPLRIVLWRRPLRVVWTIEDPAIKGTQRVQVLDQPRSSPIVRHETPQSVEAGDWRPSGESNIPCMLQAR